MFSKICKTVLIVFVLLIPLYARSWYEASLHLSAGEELLKGGELREGVEALRQALSWHTPGNHYSLKAKQLLYAQASDGSLEPEQRIETLEAIKRGLMGSRNILNLSSTEQEVNRIDKELRTLWGEGYQTAIRELHPPYFSPLNQLLAQICFWGWIASVIYLICTAFKADGSFERSKAANGITYGLSFFLLWLLSLSFA